MSIDIKETAIISPDAELAPGVIVGPYAVIGADVKIGAGTVIGPHVRIDGPVTIGERNQFVGQASIGTPPQDLKFKGEKTELRIGDDNVFREFVTINRGTVGGGGITTIGSGNFFMAYAHVAHDCHVGSNTIFANNATLAGHVDVGDFSTIGAFSAVHQFCRVGNHAFIGGGSICTQDVLPFVKTVGNRPAKTYGVNTIGLERKGFSKETVEALQRAYRLLIRSKLKAADALARIEAELGHIAEVRYLVEFVRGSKRGVIR
ncbi:MAG TPA: acyl-ACP--UDP-N-acetylglucosamine O-acyltransferase [Thermoanaerobaculia bacterium]|nr:acyl-ACP--UDP-N-acetylglucosamine O-acyltransferase [Thermoanaerobaculia bacterium]